MDIRQKEERNQEKERQLDSTMQKVQLLEGVIQDYQQRLEAMQVEKVTLTTHLGEQNRLVEDLTDQVRALELQAERWRADMRVMQVEQQLGASREQGALTRQLEEAQKEMAVYKARAEGWQRDAQSLQERLRASEDQVASMKSSLEQSTRDRSAAMEERGVREDVIRSLQQQVSLLLHELKSEVKHGGQHQKGVSGMVETHSTVGDKRPQGSLVPTGQGWAEGYPRSVGKVEGGVPLYLPPLRGSPPPEEGGMLGLPSTSLQEDLALLRRYVRSVPCRTTCEPRGKGRNPTS